MTRKVFVGLIGLAAALAATAMFEVEIQSTSPDGERRSIVVAPSEIVAARVAADTDRLPEMEAMILARPLFEASRRPPERRTTGAGASTPSLPRLAGIIVGPAGRSVIFAGPTGERPLVLAEGDKVGGYLIQSIVADQVVVTSRDGSRVLHPSFDPNALAVQRTAVSLSAVASRSEPTGRVTLPGLTGRPPGLMP